MLHGVDAVAEYSAHLENYIRCAQRHSKVVIMCENKGG